MIKIRVEIKKIEVNKMLILLKQRYFFKKIFKIDKLLFRLVKKKREIIEVN